MPTTDCEYQLRIPSQTDNLGMIREFVSKVADKVGFDEDDIGKIELACDEACTNIIKHAYAQKNGNQTLDVLIKVEFDKFILVVTDHGKGFDPQKIKTPHMEQYLAEFKVGGLGIYLMKTLMDEVDYNIQPGVQNQVRMVKYFIDKKDSKTIKAPEERS